MMMVRMSALGVGFAYKLSSYQDLLYYFVVVLVSNDGHQHGDATIPINFEVLTDSLSDHELEIRMYAVLFSS
jgi:hypothetical protein